MKRSAITPGHGVATIRPIWPMLCGKRRGVGAIEVLVIVVVVAIVAMVLMMVLLRSREAARSASCARNLRDIGIALELFDQKARRLPAVAPLGGLDRNAPENLAPLALMLDRFGTTDLGSLDADSDGDGDGEEGSAFQPGSQPPTERFIPGFVCPSDPIATSRVFPAPVSYRANTGNRTDGRLGPFEPGASVSIAEVEAGHGSSYTAAFAERLVGTAGTSSETIRDYQRPSGTVPQSGCPELPNAPLLDDAGRSWRESGWRSTLYTHAAPPGAPRSCIADDGRTAFMGASSGHVEGVRVLLLDGSVTVYTKTVNPAVWEALGSFQDGERASSTQPTPVEESSPEESERSESR